ncbi:MAG: aldehyde dehydrogenase family protein, partial [Holophaga sp.]|nr:aldehyde dehydrogenase family protein [Holophaga sp.]
MKGAMEQVLGKLGIAERNPGGFAGQWLAGGKTQRVVSPLDGEVLATVGNVDRMDFEQILAGCHQAAASWRLVPAPKRGEVVRALGDEIRRNKEALAELVTLEMGKTLREGLGEVQEMIDVCDFAVGLSRQLYGRTMPSER